MPRVLMIAFNCGLLVLLLIGLPAATRNQIGNLQLSSASTTRLIMVSGFSIAVGLNVLAALFVIKAPKQKTICWEWAGIFGALLLAEYAFLRGYLNFNWLRSSLLWLQHHL